MERKVRTVCFDCHSKCGVILTVDGDKITKVEGDPNHPVSEGILCMKAYSAQDIHAHPDRLKYPLKRVGARGEGKWERITWDEALDIIEETVRETLAEDGPSAVAYTQGTGRGSNHWGGRMQGSVGTGGGIGVAHLCLMPNLAQTFVTWGRMFHPHEACDYRNAGCVVAWGTNPIRSRQYSGLRMLDMKRGGGKLIVVDPVFRDIAAKADLWVPVRPGTDGAIAMCIANLIFQNGTYGADTLKKWTNATHLVNPLTGFLLRESDINAEADPERDHFVVMDLASGAPAAWRPESEDFDRENVDPALTGTHTVTLVDGSEIQCKTAFETYKDVVAEFTPERVSEICWTPAEKLYKMYDLLVGNKPSLLSPYLGACMMTTNALQNGRAISLLQLLLDPPIDDAGGIYFNKFWEFMTSPVITRPQDMPQVPRFGEDKYPFLCRFVGGHWPAAAWEAAIDGKIKVVLSVANDALDGYEYPQNVYKGIMAPTMKLVAVMDYWMTPYAELADIVLPAAHWTERTGAFDEELYPEPCPFVIPQIAVEPPGEAKDDWYFYRELGKRFKPEVWPWESSEEMQLWRLKEFHGFEPASYEEAAEIGYFVAHGGEHRITRQHEKGLVKFNTASRRIEFFSEFMVACGYPSPLPSFGEPAEGPNNSPEVFAEYPLVLTTGGRDYPFYHSAWTNIAKQRIIEPYPYVEINEEDARDLGVSDGEWVHVESLRGRITMKARVTKAIMKGVVNMPRPTYKDACKELGLPGYSWDKANPNILIPTEGADVGWGSTQVRGSLCRVVKIAEA